MKKKITSGIVTTNEDPAKVGRIKVTLAEVDGQEFPEWIEPVFVPGWFSPPEAGDEVKVEIPEGDDLAEFAHEVKYHGQVFSEGHGPPDELKQQDKMVHLRGYFTKAGHRLLFDDKDKVISLYTKEGYSLILSEKDSAITMNTPAKHTLLLDESAGKARLTHKDKTMVSITDAGIFIGSESATEPLVLGNLWKTLESAFMGAFLTHFHLTGVGPSGPPEDPAKTTVTNLQSGVNANTQLSDFVKSQKVKPV